MIAWSVWGDDPCGPVDAGAADNYPAAVEAMLDTVRGALLGPDPAGPAGATRYALHLDGDQVAVLAVGVDRHGRPDRDEALGHLARIEEALCSHHTAPAPTRPSSVSKDL